MYEFSWSKDFFQSTFALVAFCAAAYAAAFFIIGKTFAPPDGNMFAVILVWACGHIGGFIAVRCRLPALLGMLGMGVLLRNVPGELLRAYKHSWESRIKAFGLCTILFRAGLKIDYAKALKLSPAATLLLGTLPVLFEGFLDSAIFATVYGFPYTVAAASGFLMSAISPTVVVTGMLDLQKKYYGATHGVPSIEMAAAGIDVVTGIALYSVFEAIAVSQATSLATGASVSPWIIVRGPLSIPLGFLASCLGGAALGCTKIFNDSFMRTLCAFALVQLFMFVYFDYGMVGAGALSAIGTASVAGLFWSMGWPRGLSLGPQPRFRANMDETVAIFWLLVMQPLLFCSIGTSIFFDEIPASVIPKAIIVIVVGSCARILAGGLAVAKAGWTRNEMIFAAISWIPKATVQGALSSAPLDAFQEAIPESSPYYAVYSSYGYQILATAVLSIIFTAPLGLVIINIVGHKLLRKQPPPSKHEVDAVAEAEDSFPTALELHSSTENALGKGRTSKHASLDLAAGDSDLRRVTSAKREHSGGTSFGRSMLDLDMCDANPLKRDGGPVSVATQTNWDTMMSRLYSNADHMNGRDPMSRFNSNGESSLFSAGGSLRPQDGSSLRPHHHEGDSLRNGGSMWQQPSGSLRPSDVEAPAVAAAATVAVAMIGDATSTSHPLSYQPSHRASTSSERAYSSEIRPQR